MNGRRSSMLRARMHRFPDPETSPDPRIQTLLSELRSVPFAPPPDPAFRAELRTQLVAIAPRLIVEGEHAHTAGRRPRPGRSTAPHLGAVASTTTGKRSAAPSHAATGHAAPSHAAHARTRQIAFARPLRIAASVAAAFLLILGGAVWMSQKALPGDSLYSLKRAGERIQLSLDGNDLDRARDHLEFAQTRVAEAQALLRRATASGAGVQAGGVSASTSSLITSTLGAADADVLTAWSLLATQAAKADSTQPLKPMLTWAPGQYQRLRDLTAVMPTKPLRARADASAGLIQVAQDRARTLRANINCRCVDIAKSDYIVPVLCPSCNTAAPARPAGTGSRTGGHASVRPNGTATRTRPGQQTGSIPPRTTTQPRAARSTAKRVPIPALPSVGRSLPTTRSVPISRSRAVPPSARSSQRSPAPPRPEPRAGLSRGRHEPRADSSRKPS